MERFGFQVRCALDRVSVEKQLALERLSQLAKSLAATSDTSDDSSNEDASDDDVSQTLLPPSEETIAHIGGIFRNLFSASGRIAVDVAKKALALCPLEEDVLRVEDRDHYNLLHKAIIFDSLELAELLASRVVDVNVCRACGPRCPHSSLGALHLAAFLGRHRLVVWLLALAADPHAPRRVYPSAPVDCPPGRQVAPLCSGRDERVAELLSTCGAREPAFFAVIGDRDRAMLLLLSDGRWGGTDDRRDSPTAEGGERNGGTAESERNGIAAVTDEDGDGATDGDGLNSETRWSERRDGTLEIPDGAGVGAVDARHGYLLHVACRVGCLRCLHWLLLLYPAELRVSASDGLPALLLALPHGPAPVCMLLRAGADVRDVQHFWEEGRNMLHLLFAAMPFDRACRGGVRLVAELSIGGGASVREERQVAGRTPLHDWAAAVNCVHAGSTPADVRAADTDLLRCLATLLHAGAPVCPPDADGDTPLAILAANRRYVDRVDAGVAVNGYGLENVAAATAILLTAAPPELRTDERPLLHFLQNLHLPAVGRDDALYDGYVDVVRVLARGQQLSDEPLRRLLGHVRREADGGGGSPSRLVPLVDVVLRWTLAPRRVVVAFLLDTMSAGSCAAPAHELLPLFLARLSPDVIGRAARRQLLDAFSQAECPRLVATLANHSPYSPDAKAFAASRPEAPSLKRISRHAVWAHCWMQPDPPAAVHALAIPLTIKTYLLSFAD